MTLSEFHLVQDGSKRDSRGRRRFPKAERERLAQESFTCGMSLRAFARSEGLNYHTLVHWRQLIRKKSKDNEAIAKPASIHFAECTLASGSAMLEVELPDGTHIHSEDAEALAHLLKALRC